MGQISSSPIDTSSLASNVLEPNSISQNPDYQIQKDDAQQSKSGGEADQSKNGEEEDQTKGREVEAAQDEEEEEEAEEEEGECGLCLFMKGGECGDSFAEWMKCVEEAEKNKEDAVTKCSQITSNLTKCMAANSYYDPIIKVEKAVERESEKKSDEQTTSTSDLLTNNT